MPTASPGNCVRWAHGCEPCGSPTHGHSRTWATAARSPRGSISRIERGTTITLDVLWRLADAFGVHWADLLDDRTPNAPVRQRPAAPFEHQLHTFGTRAYRTRAMQRLSQQAVADRTGLGLSTIYSIEHGTRNVTVQTLSRLAAGLRVHWADLLDDHQAPPPHPNHTDPVPGLLPDPETLADAFASYDQTGLAELSTGQLRRHLFARRLLSDYLDQLWHNAHLHHAHHPTAPQDEWSSLAMLRHLTHRLLTTAQHEHARRH